MSCAQRIHGKKEVENSEKRVKIIVKHVPLWLLSVFFFYDTRQIVSPKPLSTLFLMKSIDFHWVFHSLFKTQFDNEYLEKKKNIWKNRNIEINLSSWKDEKNYWTHFLQTLELEMIFIVPRAWEWVLDCNAWSILCINNTSLASTIIDLI